MAEETGEVLKYGDAQLDSVSSTLTLGTKSIRLTPLEAKLLGAMMREPARVYGEQELAEAIWSTESLGHSSDGPRLAMVVNRLRAKLTPSFIHGIRGQGYRLGPAPETVHPTTPPVGQAWTTMHQHVHGGDSVGALISYSHRDERFRQVLETHLSLLQRQGLLSVWHDRRIGAGTEWEGQINNRLDSAELILLLVSPDFLASSYCYDVEVKRAMERHEAGTARVIPIILRPVDWHDAPFGKLQALPKDGKAISRWPNRDEAFRSVVEGIRHTVQELRASKPAPVAPVFNSIRLPHHWSERPAQQKPDPIDGPKDRLPLRAEQISQTDEPRDGLRGEGRILDFRVSSLGQYDATVEWRTNATMQVRTFLFQARNETPQRPPVSVQSLGQPGPRSHMYEFVFHDLQPGTLYRAVAESDDDRQELTFTTHEA